MLLPDPLLAAPRRDEVVLATKGGLIAQEATRCDIAVNGHPRNIHAVREASLRRLGVEHIDLYYLHQVDPAVPVEDNIGAMREFIPEDRIRALGFSEVAVGNPARA